MIDRQCYACDDPATTVEHIPPKVIFPERKDLVEAGSDVTDLRVGLVTVPACRAHNNAFSTDDEYAAYAIAMKLGNHRVAVHQWHTKVRRALSRTPNLRTLFTQNVKSVDLDGTELLAVEFDRRRVAAVMERIARGLLFHHGHGRLDGAFRCHFPSLVFPDGSSGDETELGELCKPLDRLGWQGNNPQAFRYQIHNPALLLLVRLQFYEDFEAILTLTG